MIHPASTTWTLARARLEDEGGFSAGAEVMLVGSLVFMTMLVLGINAWNMLDADMAVSAAAREGARAFVESSSAGTAHANAQAAATNAAQQMGRSGVTVQVSGTLRRCEPVVVQTRMEVELLRFPFVDLAVGSRQVSDTHTEIVDPYRSGLPGTAACP